MGTGIIICGLNGTGKSTLGKALAEKLHFYFIDNEDLYFPKIGPAYVYAAPLVKRLKSFCTVRLKNTKILFFCL